MGVLRPGGRRDGEVLAARSGQLLAGPSQPPGPAQGTGDRVAPGQPGALPRALLRAGQARRRRPRSRGMGGALLVGRHGVRHHVAAARCHPGRTGRPFLRPSQTGRHAPRRSRGAARVGATWRRRAGLAEPGRQTVPVGLPAPQGPGPGRAPGALGRTDERPGRPDGYGFSEGRPWPGRPGAGGGGPGRWGRRVAGPVPPGSTSRTSTPGPFPPERPRPRSTSTSTRPTPGTYITAQGDGGPDGSRFYHRRAGSRHQPHGGAARATSCTSSCRPRPGPPTGARPGRSSRWAPGTAPGRRPGGAGAGRVGAHGRRPRPGARTAEAGPDRHRPAGAEEDRRRELDGVPPRLLDGRAGLACSRRPHCVPAW